MQVEPVIKQVPVSESQRVRVFDIPFSGRYRVESTLPNGTVQVDEAKAYTESLSISDSGRITIVINSKVPSIGRKRISYPHYFTYNEDVLCCLKKFEMADTSRGGLMTFGLNYDFFNIPWKLCVVAHNMGGQRRVFYASRAEWDRGRLLSRGREVQVFLSIPEERHFDLDLFRAQANSAICKWVDDVSSRMTRKGI